MNVHPVALERFGQVGHWHAPDPVLLRPLAEVRSVPHALTFVDATGLTRLTRDGPLTAGPLALVTPAPYAPRGGLLRLEGGDVVVLKGHSFLVEIYDRQVLLRPTTHP